MFKPETPMLDKWRKEREEKEALSPVHRCKEKIRELKLLGQRHLLGEDDGGFELVVNEMLTNLETSGTVDGKPWDIKKDISELNYLKPWITKRWNDEVINRMKLMAYLMAHKVGVKTNSVDVETITEEIVGTMPILCDIVERQERTMSAVKDVWFTGYYEFKKLNAATLIAVWTKDSINMGLPVSDKMIVDTAKIFNFLVDTAEVSTGGAERIRGTITELLGMVFEKPKPEVEINDCKGILHLLPTRLLEKYLANLNYSEKCQILFGSSLVETMIEPPKGVTKLSMSDLGDEFIPPAELDELGLRKIVMELSNEVFSRSPNLEEPQKVYIAKHKESLLKVVAELDEPRKSWAQQVIHLERDHFKLDEKYLFAKKYTDFVHYDWETFANLDTKHLHKPSAKEMADLEARKGENMQYFREISLINSWEEYQKIIKSLDQKIYVRRKNKSSNNRWNKPTRNHL